MELINSFSRCFLSESSVGLYKSILLEEEAKELLKTKCSHILREYKNTKVRIYRGFSGIKRGVTYLVNASVGKTKSTYLDTRYYYLLLDNLPSWKGFPKRTKSIICTNSIPEAGYYSGRNNMATIVYPFNDSQIVICPVHDVWTAFVDRTGYSLRELDARLSDIGYSVYKSKTEFDADWKQLTDFFKRIDRDINGNTTKGEKIKKILGPNLSNTNGNILKRIDKMLDPIIEGFRLMKPSEFSSIPSLHFSQSGGREIWVTDHSILSTKDYSLTSLIS